MEPRNRPGPAPSEATLIRLWDLLDHLRVDRGERVAQAVANKALAAAEAEAYPLALPKEVQHATH